MCNVLLPANSVVFDWDYKYQLTCQMLLSSGPVALIMPLLILSVQLFRPGNDKARLMLGVSAILY